MAKKDRPEIAGPGDMMQAPDVDARIGGVRTEDAPLDWDKLTLNGQPIPAALRHQLPYKYTDQGAAEANAGKTPPSGVSVLRDSWDAMLDARGNLEPWETTDPLVEGLNRVKEPGFAYKYLSPTVIDKKGMRRYEPALDKEGQQVKVGKMILGRMPEELRDRRNAHYQKIGNDELANVELQFRTDQVRALRNAGLSENDVLRPDETLSDYDNPERTATVGVRSRRGDQAA